MSVKKLYKFYIKRVFPHIYHLRGATRAKLILRSILLNKLETYQKEPQSIFDRGEWDNLIVLDACRYDKYNDMREYEVESRTTLGSSSQEYLQRNFTDEKYDDIVYISANGFFTDEMMEDLIGRTNIFHAKFDTILERWDGEKGTVLPEDVVKDAKTAEKLFPDKKKLYTLYNLIIPT